MNYISFKNKDVTHIIDCMQYDTDRTAEFMVEENVEDKNITYEIKTTNDKEVKGDCTISDDNVVSFLIPENVTASPGIYKGQLISRDSAESSTQISSFPFLISVAKAVHEQDDPYEVALSEVRQATQDCIDATEDLDDVKQAAHHLANAIEVAGTLSPFHHRSDRRKLEMPLIRRGIHFLHTGSEHYIRSTTLQQLTVSV